MSDPSGIVHLVFRLRAGRHLDDPRGGADATLNCRPMAYVITQPCIDVKDKSCIDVCPVSCIYFETDELDRKLYIHPDECIDCGACEPECPVTAIFEESAVPDEWREFIELDKSWTTGGDAEKNAVRARINEIQPPA